MIPLGEITAALEAKQAEVSAALDVVQGRIDELENQSSLNQMQEAEYDRLQDKAETLEAEQDDISTAISLLDNYV